MEHFSPGLPVIRIGARRGTWRTDAGLLTAAAASVVVAMAGPLVIRRAGGFVVAPVPAALAPAGQIPRHARLVLESVLTLFGADFIGLQSWPAALAVLHLAGVIGVTWACCAAGRRLLAAQERLPPLLFVGAQRRRGWPGESSASRSRSATVPRR